MATRTRRVRRAAAVACALVVLVLLAPPAAAEDVSSAQLRQLAQAAQHDPAALEHLRSVDRVDGRPADLKAALADSDSAELAERLRTIAGGEPASGTTADAARRAASHILSGRQYHPRQTPAPFRRPLHWLGQRLYPLVRPFVRLFRAILRNTVLEVLAGAAVLLLGIALGVRLARSRTAVADLEGGHLHRRRPEDPAALEAAADEAERNGDLERAVRLRFRAGLVRLDRAGAIALRPSITTGQLRATITSPSFRGLSWRFDQIAYGGQPAHREDVEAAKLEWPRVLEEVGR
jgi:hypothetical protein